MDIDKSLAPPPPRPKRTIKQCLCVSCILIAAAIGVVITFFVVKFTRSTIESVRDPHKALVYNGTITPDLTSSTVVRPLIDGETRFDVLFTVYARIPNDDVSEDKQRQEYSDERNYSPEEYTGREISLSSKTGRSPVEIRYMPSEKIVYQGVVMEDLTLDHRDVETKVNFNLPLKRFYDHYLYAPDVRGAIALIPRPPSKLDRLEDYTHWKPEDVEFPFRINPEYIASSSLGGTYQDEDTKRWAALEHISHAFPLIEFHTHDDPCKNSTNNEQDNTNEEVEDDLYASIQDDEEKSKHNVTGSDPVAVPVQEDSQKSGNVTGRAIAPGSQPYLISRAHVYIINETRLFERKAYDKAHKDLRKNACGKGFSGGLASRFLCSRTYESNGHWDNRFVLRPQEGKKSKELAYSPYLGHLTHAAGPKDVRPLPVTRNNCSDSTKPDPESIPVNFTLRFSSLTPARVNLLNNFVGSHRSAHNATEWELAHKHNEWEQANGVFGSRTPGTHPKTRLFLTTIKTLLAFPVIILELIYWYTRQTTTGINHYGVYTQATGILAAAAIGLYSAWEQDDNESWGDTLLLILFVLFEITPAILQLRTVLPFEVQRNGWWRFTVSRWRWSHSERNSMRRGTGVDYRIWVGVFLALSTVIYIPTRYKLTLVNPSIIPTFSDHNPKPSLMEKPIISSMIHSIDLLAMIIQLAHNERSKTFAGHYALTTYFMFAFRWLELVYYLPFVVGKYDVHMGIAYITVIEIVIEGVMIRQAWSHPKIDQKAEEMQE
ncbi:uncharacterized protein I303_103212 [Kwoniella dejecticola CBS 10117]|uniref:Uncharacterized protein n=1 Tax=Kwoniella dejecticola CBS 10117 TaxID=1296121 RepID=A0A1A6AAW8_9TREE|nr:uncharacterized protein I303_03236 [Kwoniella dejecticola CBS 10117]OBR87212.1 hypothetical protein I303_03236 [Kwoniella dejecticola CBS 10117]